MSSDELLGQVIGGYRLEALLGKGGAGRVYRAVHPETGLSVALKVLQPGFFPDEEFHRRFDREMNVCQELNHPNIVPIYANGRLENARFVVMHLVEGVTLSHLLRRRDVPLRRFLWILKQIADALAACHAADIVHRDVKPTNIMIEDDRAYLMDFGLARHTSGDTISSPQFVLGTPLYMSPEQVKGTRATAASDVFSMGTILYEASTGLQPFGWDIPEDEPNRYDGTVKIMDRISISEIPPLPERIPEPLARIVRTCLDVDPARRYPTAAELSLNLDSLLNDPSWSESLDRPAVPYRPRPALKLVAAATTHPSPRKRGLYWMAVGIAAAALLGAAAILWFVFKSS